MSIGSYLLLGSAAFSLLNCLTHLFSVGAFLSAFSLQIQCLSLSRVHFSAVALSNARYARFRPSLACSLLLVVIARPRARALVLYICSAPYLMTTSMRRPFISCFRMCSSDPSLHTSRLSCSCATSSPLLRAFLLSKSLVFWVSRWPRPSSVALAHARVPVPVPCRLLATRYSPR